MYTHLQQRDSDRPPVTLSTLQQMKQRGEKIACLTAYDASFAALLDAAGVDVVLVGDSLGMVIQGHDTTVPVTMDQMVYHCSAVSRGLSRPFLIADLPFMSYASPQLALTNSVRLMQEGGARMVKLERGQGQTETIAYLARHDIAVCAHLGLRPQSVHKTGGFRVQGREEEAARQMMDDALALEAAGADIVLLECIPAPLGERISHAVKVPVIGIGAGAEHRRANPGALRHARHHARSQAALRAQFCDRRHHARSCNRALRASGQVRRISGAGTLLPLNGAVL